MPSEPSSSSMYVTKLDLSLQQKLLAHLKEEGFEIQKPPHTLFQGKKKGIVCTLYESGKLVVQGKGIAEFIEFYLEPELLGSFKLGYENLDVDKEARIGVDEAGKGDFFGPLCIAGVYAGPEEIERLLEIGVKDSKRMTDPVIRKMAAKIRESIPHHVVRIGPPRYNQLYSQFGNLNQLLAWGHATVIEALSKKTGCQRALIDQFTHHPLVANFLAKKHLNIDLTMRTKGESDPVVAAASILAREGFITGLDILSQWIGFELPKGASAKVLQIGERIYREKGVEIFQEIGKKHFKTLDDILRQSGESNL